MSPAISRFTFSPFLLWFNWKHKTLKRSFLTYYSEILSVIGIDSLRLTTSFTEINTNAFYWGVNYPLCCWLWLILSNRPRYLSSPLPPTHHTKPAVHHEVSAALGGPSFLRNHTSSTTCRRLMGSTWGSWFPTANFPRLPLERADLGHKCLLLERNVLLQTVSSNKTRPNKLFLHLKWRQCPLN